VTDHLKQFGTVEIERGEFHTLLEKALLQEANFLALPKDASTERILEIVNARA
jgi:leucyl/phenylalanyl-tRNA--protein transferase